MPSIKSEIGTQQLKAPGYRQVEVPNADADYANLQEFSRNMSENKELAAAEAEAREIRQIKAGVTRLGPAAKSRIDALLFPSRANREVSLDGHIFTLRTLKSKDQRQAVLAASNETNGLELSFEMRRQLLARSLCQVDGSDIELFLGNNSLEARLEWMDEMDEHIISKLYSEYLALIDETQRKYGLKSEAEVKEVLSDLKK